MITGDDRTKQWTTGGQQSGTHLGEAIRSMMQFKSFPIAYSQRVLGPMFRGQPGRRDLAGIPHLIAMSLAFGYVAMTAKDIMKNKTPKDPTAYETWLAALTQSGGAGLYGDFLFGNADRFGGGLLGDLAGPTDQHRGLFGTLVMEDRDRITQLFTGELSDGNKLWGDLAKFGLNNTPYLNLHFLRAGLDLAILNSFQEWLSPGTFRRREREMEKSLRPGVPHRSAGGAARRAMSFSTIAAASPRRPAGRRLRTALAADPLPGSPAARSSPGPRSGSW